MSIKISGVISALIASLLVASCSNENPIQVSDSEEKTTPTALIDYSVPPTTWPLSTMHVDAPSMIMSTDPAYPGRLELLKKTSENRIQHFWWNESSSDLNAGTIFGTNVLSSAALCSYLNDNKLNAVVREASNENKVAHYVRDKISMVWTKQCVIGDKFIGTPAMLCNKSTKNLEVVSWTYDNKIAHWQRRGSRNSDWGTAARYTITPPADYVIVQDPVIAQNAQGNMFLAVYAIYNGSELRLLVYKRTTGDWTRLPHKKLEPEANRWVKPSICDFGSQGWVSILVPATTTPIFFEYRLKNSSTSITGGENFHFENHVSIKSICHVKKDSKYIYLYSAYGTDYNPLITKMAYIDGK